MKHTIFLLFLACFSFKAKAQSNNAETVSQQIANRLKDSLSLNESQRLQLFQVNMQLHNRKQQLWQQYSNTDSVQVYSQRIENTRDSLYQPILSAPQFILYQQKKKNLVRIN